MQATRKQVKLEYAIKYASDDSDDDDSDDSGGIYFSETVALCRALYILLYIIIYIMTTFSGCR